MLMFCQKNIRKISAVLCSICMMFMICTSTLTLYAQNTPEIKVSSGTVERGKTVDVTLELSGNTGIWGMKLKVGYNHQAMTLKEIKIGDVFAEDEVTLPDNYDKEKLVFYASADELQNIVKDGKLVTLSFEVSSEASYEDYPVTVEITQVIDVEGNDIQVATVNGKVTVQKSNGEKNDDESSDVEDDEGNNVDDDASNEKDTVQESNNEKGTGSGIIDSGVQTNDTVMPVIAVMLFLAGAACIVFVKNYSKRTVIR